MHLFLSSKPACGKTTLIKEILKYLKNLKGFFTEEILNSKNERVGFKIITLSGKEKVFAHIDFKSNFKVSKYFIDLDSFNSIALEELEDAKNSDCEFVVIDEIGKMELLSNEFKNLCLDLINKKRIIATIPAIEEPFIDSLKNRKDVYVLNLNKENFNEIKEKLLFALKAKPLSKIRETEEKAKKIGLDERILIENASSYLANEIFKLDIPKNIIVISGIGNNGADVLSCARKLSARNYNVSVVILKEKELKEEVIFQKNILEKIKIPLCVIEEDNIKYLEDLIRDKEVILDGIFGIGLNKEISNFFKNAIEIINKSKKIVISCDIPSGISADNGFLMPIAVKADYTITFIAPKFGFFLNEGKNFCGKIILVDIGIPLDF